MTAPHVTAEILNELARLAITTCETLEAAVKHQSELAGEPGVAGDNDVARAVANGFADEREYLIAAGNVANALADELFRRSELCHQYSAEVAAWEQRRTAYQRAAAAENTTSAPLGVSPPGPKPSPPFPGAQVSQR